MTASAHIPVLLDEVVAALHPAVGQTYVDCTAGLGGHAAALAPFLSPTGTVVLNDLDSSNLAAAAARVRALPNGPKVIAIQANFASIPRRLTAIGCRADLVLADLGFASNQVDDPGRGMSFNSPGPLDMRLDPTAPTTAATLVASLTEEELADIIHRHGEERFARIVARRIVEERKAAPILTTDHLARIVRSAVRSSGGIDPATRTFQALRIAVNDELGNLDALLAAIESSATDASWLAPNAVVAIIAFHSLEDRPVKQCFERLSKAGRAVLLTPKPVQATPEEVRRNPRSRSARMRAIRFQEEQLPPS